MCDLGTLGCSQCKKTFNSVKNLTAHVRKVHSKPKFQCGDCLRIFPSKHTIEKHVKFHHTKTECPICKTLLKNRNSLRTHVHVCKMKSKSKVDVDPSGKKIRKTDGVIAQKGTKSKSKKDIGKGTVFKSTIQCPLSCNICPKTFRDPSGLYKHVKTHEKTEQIKMLQTSDSVIIDILRYGCIIKAWLCIFYL